MPIKHIGILGGGLMGSGIAQVCAQAGYTTTVREISDLACKHAESSIEKALSKGIEKGKLTQQDRDKVLAHLSFTTDLAPFEAADIVIEAVVEDIAVKRSMFQELDTKCPDHTIFATNTSSLTVTELGAATNRPDRFVGLHFFNPVPVMPLVEVVRAVQTSSATLEQAFSFATSLGKQPIQTQDRSGFVVNYLLVPYMIDAIRAVESGVASIQDIDKGMTLGAGHPMGPLTLLDFVGLDTTYKIAEIMFDEYREARYAPPPLLKRMVMAGLYGKKSGKGFYDYSQNPPVPNDLGLS